MQYSELTPEERARVTAQVDHFVDLMAHRYNVTPDDVVDAVRWVKARKEFSSKLSLAGSASLLALVVSALAAALWEGVRSLIRAKGGG